MKKHLFGAWAAFLALAFSFALAGVSATAGEAASQPGQDERKELMSAFRAQFEKQEYAQCESLLQQIRTRFPRNKSAQRFEYELGRKEANSRGADADKGRAHLEKFLPSGPCAQSEFAPQARLAYAQYLAEHGRLSEAKPLLEDALTSGGSNVARRSFLQADVRGLVESPEAIERWKDGLNDAVGRAGQRIEAGQPWVQEAPKASQQRKRANQLRDDARSLPVLQAAAGALATRGEDEEGFAVLRRQSMAKMRVAEALPPTTSTGQSQQAWAQVETLAAQALAQLPALNGLNASDPLDVNQLRARNALGVSRFQLGKRDESAALFQEAAAFAGDPRCQGDAFAQRAIAQARVWLIACLEARKAPAEEIRQGLLDLVENQDAAPGQLAWAFGRLASRAGVEGRVQDEYLYLKDLKEFLGTGRWTYAAVVQLQALAQSHPEVETAAGAHSDAYQKMAAKGRVTTDAKGRAVFKTIQPQRDLVESGGE